MNNKRTILAVLGLMVGLMITGCGNHAENEEKAEKTTEKAEIVVETEENEETQKIERIEVNEFASEEVIAKKKDAFCGEGIGVCASGLLCLPRTAGEAIRICKTAIVDETKDCQVTNVKEVCAERDGESTTYLNACFSAAHGAKVQSEGRCKPA